MILTFSQRQDHMILTFSQRRDHMILTFSQRQDHMILTFSQRRDHMILTFSQRYRYSLGLENSQLPGRGGGGGRGEPSGMEQQSPDTYYTSSTHPSHIAQP